MSKHNHVPAGQLGFDDLLADAEQDNHMRLFERKSAHLPGSMEEALPFYRKREGG